MKQTSTLTRRLSEQQENVAEAKRFLAEGFRAHIRFALPNNPTPRSYLLRTFDRWLKRR